MTDNFSIDDVFASKYLSAADLVDRDGNPKDFTLTIADAWREEFKDRKTGQEQVKIGISFKEAKKGMLLNKTNARRIAQLLGSPQPKNWIGKAITLYQTEVDFQGEMKPAIRVRGKLPGHEAAASVGHAAPAPRKPAAEYNPPPDERSNWKEVLDDEVPF